MLTLINWFGQVSPMWNYSSFLAFPYCILWRKHTVHPTLMERGVRHYLPQDTLSTELLGIFHHGKLFFSISSFNYLFIPIWTCDIYFIRWLTFQSTILSLLLKWSSLGHWRLRWFLYSFDTSLSLWVSCFLFYFLLLCFVFTLSYFLGLKYFFWLILDICSSSPRNKNFSKEPSSYYWSTVLETKI